MNIRTRAVYQTAKGFDVMEKLWIVRELLEDDTGLRDEVLDLDIIRSMEDQS